MCDFWKEFVAAELRLINFYNLWDKYSILSL